MDESNPPCNKRFAGVGAPQTEETRRSRRELIVTTPGLGESISGAILYDDTIRQRKKDGTPFGRWRFHLPAPSSNRTLDIWKGQKDKIGAAQKILYHRAKCNSMARRGEYAQG